jgi:hypothetical protein
MRLALPALSAALLLCAASARAQDTATPADLGANAAGIMFNTSISLNLPLVGTDRAARQAEEDSYRRDLYARSVDECRVLLDSIAKSCTITSVNVSTQTNSNPGQPDYLYVSSNITMQVELK